MGSVVARLAVPGSVGRETELLAPGSGDVLREGLGNEDLVNAGEDRDHGGRGSSGVHPEVPDNAGQETGVAVLGLGVLEASSGALEDDWDL